MTFLFEWINQHAGLTQALATVVLVILTFIYVRHTSSLAHAPFYAMIMPTQIRTDSNSLGWQITLYNAGPGIALSIRLTTIAAKNRVRDLKSESYYWLLEDWCTADGPYAINPSEEKEFLIKHLLDFNKPFFIQWETQTGRKKKSAWKILIDDNDKVVGLSSTEEMLFRIHWAFSSIKTSFRLLMYVITNKVNRK